MTYNEQIKAARTAAGFTQKELAEKIGVDPRQVQHWEAGSHAPKMDHLLKICEILNCTIVLPKKV